MEPLKTTTTVTHKSEYPKNPKVGDLLVYHTFARDYDGTTMHLHPVESPEEAIKVINKLADEQVNDESIAWNVLGLEVFDECGDWEDWYDDDYNDILEFEDQMLENIQDCI